MTDAADSRAERLLVSHLSTYQRITYRLFGTFTVKGNWMGRRYRISQTGRVWASPGIPHCIDYDRAAPDGLRALLRTMLSMGIPEELARAACGCDPGEPMPMPRADLALTLKLLIETNEREFLLVADRLGKETNNQRLQC